jgi:Protein of unknown function (DUF1573)/Flagellar-associated PapD-like
VPRLVLTGFHMQRISLRLLVLSIALFAPATGLAVAETAQTATTAGPRAIVADPVYNFGTVLQGMHVVHTFAIRNVGKKDLVINGVKTSCGCTVAAPSKNLVVPGDESKVTVDFDTHFQKGHRDKTITVMTNDPGSPTVQLTLQGNVKVEVEATPEEASFGKVRQGTEETMDVTITDLAKDAKTFRVSKVTNTSPYIRVTQEPRKDGKPGVMLKVALLKTMPVGQFHDSIEVMNNRTTINVPVFGQVTGDLTLDPAQVSFGIVSGRDDVVRILRLTNSGNRAVNVLGVTSTNNSVVARVEPIKAGREYKITAILRRNTPQGQLRGAIAIRTDDPKQSTLTVPFYAIVGSFEG